MGFIKKVCLLGDPAVGKTSLVQRYVYDKFDEKYLSTIGTKPSVKVLEHKGTEVTLTIWDIAGQETFQNVHSSYFKGAAGAVMVCDIMRPETVKNLTHWSHRFHEAVPDSPIVLVSNKWDLIEEGSEMIGIEKEITSFAQMEDCVYIRSSAKDGTNVDEMFQTLTDMILV
jgi:small GTP-binding protein